MLCKASFFGDDECYDRILESKDPMEVKSLGRKVRDFDENLWVEFREHFVFEILKQKFGSNNQLKQILLSTRSAVLAEASATDRIWGIGLSENDPDSNNPDRWRGQNLLGVCLMRVRQHFQERA